MLSVQQNSHEDREGSGWQVCVSSRGSLAAPKGPEGLGDEHEILGSKKLPAAEGTACSCFEL